MRPVTFDSCFGTYYPGWSRKGVILCGSFGLENVRYRPALASLAEALSRRGLNVLLFDYHGTGNSTGTSLDPGILRRWTGNVEAACLWLQRQGNIDTISIAGLRLGAIVAALAASKIGELAELVLLAPPAAGDSFVAELYHASAVTSDTSSTPLPFKGIDLGGYRLGGQTIREISAFRWSGLQACNAGRVVILAENRIEDRDILSEAFAGLDCAVEMNSGLDGFERAVSDFRASRRKPPAWHTVADLITIPPVTGGLWPRPASVIPMTGPGYIETPVFSGAEQTFSGLFCRSSYGEESREAVIFLPGADGHALYWPRLPVELGRRLARAGIASLRLNDNGADDCDDLGPIDPARQLCNAVNWIKAHRYTDVTVIGGTDVAREVLDRAASGSRVDRIVLFDLPAMPLGASATARSLRAGDADTIAPDAAYDDCVGARMAAARSSLAALQRLRDFAADKSATFEPLAHRIQTCLASGKPVSIITLSGVEPSVELKEFLVSTRTPTGDWQEMAVEADRSGNGHQVLSVDCTEKRLSGDECRTAFGDCLLSLIHRLHAESRPAFRLALQTV